MKLTLSRCLLLFLMTAVFLTTASDAQSGPLRRLFRGRRSCPPMAGQVPPTKLAKHPTVCAGSVCPKYDASHHGSFCTYYSEKCFGSWVTWYGPHGHADGDCSKCSNCESAYYNGGPYHVHPDLAANGMRGPKPAVDDLDFDTNVATCQEPQGVVAQLRLPNKANPIFGQMWTIVIRESGHVIHMGHEVRSAGGGPVVQIPERDVRTVPNQPHVYEVDYQGNTYVFFTHRTT